MRYANEKPINALRSATPRANGKVLRSLKCALPQNTVIWLMFAVLKRIAGSVLACRIWLASDQTLLLFVSTMK